MRLIIFLLAICVVSPILACGKCGSFINCTDQAATPIVANNVDVQFRHLRFVDQRRLPTQEEINTALAYDRQWQMITDAIPIAPPIDQRKLFKTFQFQNKLIEQYRQPEPIVNAGYQKIINPSRTRTLRALIDFSLRTEPGGRVNLIQSSQTDFSNLQIQLAKPAQIQFAKPALPAQPAKCLT